jgi:hypothetical protein
VDKFIIWVKEEETIGEASFNSLHDISSKPVDLFTGSDLIKLYTIVLFVSVIEKLLSVVVIYCSKLEFEVGTLLTNLGPI